MVWPPSEENFTCRYPSGVRQVLLALLFFPSLFHPHLLRLYILPVPLTLAIWFALINRGEYCWHRVFPASKFLCLPYVTPKSYCSNFMDECKAEITLYGNVLIFMAHYRNISEWAVAMLTTDFSFGRRLRKPHIGQYIGITRGRIKSLAEFFFNIITDKELKSVRFRAKRFFFYLRWCIEPAGEYGIKQPSKNLSPFYKKEKLNFLFKKTYAWYWGMRQKRGKRLALYPVWWKNGVRWPQNYFFLSVEFKWSLIHKLSWKKVVMSSCKSKLRCSEKNEKKCQMKWKSFTGNLRFTVS